MSLRKRLLSKVSNEALLSTEDVESKVSWREDITSNVRSAIAKPAELSNIDDLASKAFGEGVEISQEFFGLFGGKKMTILSKIDYEASYKNKLYGESYSSVDEMKRVFSPSSVFDSELFEILPKNMDGFISFGEYDYENLKDGLDWIKSEGDCSSYVKEVKSLKTKSSFEKVAVVDADKFKDDYDFKAMEQSINYYRNDCLNSIRENIKTVEKDKGNAKFLSMLKEFLSVAEKGIKEAEDFINAFKSLFKYVEGDKVSQEFFGLFGSKKEEEKKQKGYDVIDVLIITNFFNKTYLSKIKSYFDIGAKKVSELLTKTNNEINKNGDSFSKCEEEVDKATKEYFDKSSEFGKHTFDFLTKIGVDKTYVKALTGNTDETILAFAVHNYGNEVYYSALCSKSNGGFDEENFSIDALRHGYQSLPSSSKLKLLEEASKSLTSLDLTGSTGIWKSFKEVGKRFDKGEWGEWDDNLNDKLDWYWAAQDSQAVFFDLDVKYTKEEIISMMKETLEGEKEKIKGE